MKFVAVFAFMLVLASCGDSPLSTDNVVGSFKLRCDLNVEYVPKTPPVKSIGMGAPTTTVIAIHGKSGGPTVTEHMQTLEAELNAQGYNVVMPYMPWSGLTWDGSLCDSVSYINRLIVDEKASGNSVILLGHSMGGVFALNYGAINYVSKPSAVAVIAPGHFVPDSSVLAAYHAESIRLAKEMLSNELGGSVATFQTSNYNISTSANIYLSFHANDQLASQFQSLFLAIPLNKAPTIWLSGLEDDITVPPKNLGIIDAILADTSYLYKEIAGDHYSILGNVTAELDSWYKKL